MGTVYIISDHGKLFKQNDALVFSSAEGDIRKLFLHRTDRLIIAGNVEITGSALRMLMHYKINVVFLSTNGHFNGKLQFEVGKNVFLRKRQYDSLNDESFSISVAKAVATGKLSNQITYMLRINRKEPLLNVNQTIAQAQHNLEKLQSAGNIASIRGYEGNGSKLYFSVFRLNISPGWAEFKGRSMNPPKDNVNSVLSFLYTLLMYRVDSFVEMEGLDPYVGYLHTLGFGKRSLTFDLMEEFRAPICDTLACSLFNLGILNLKDFNIIDFNKDNDDAPLQYDESAITESDQVLTSDSIKGVLLTKDGLRKVAVRFEEKLDSELFYPPEATKMSYQRIIAAQIHRFRLLLSGEETDYKPFMVK